MFVCMELFDIGTQMLHCLVRYCDNPLLVAFAMDMDVCGIEANRADCQSCQLRYTDSRIEQQDHNCSVPVSNFRIRGSCQQQL